MAKALEMNSNQFADEIQEWKKKFLGLLEFFRSEHFERGMQAYKRWKRQFELYLRRHAPTEAKEFITISDQPIVSTNTGTDLEDFMRGAGNACLGYLEELESAIRQNQVFAAMAMSLTSIKANFNQLP